MRHLLTVEVTQPKANDRYRYDGQSTYLSGPVATAPDGQVGFPAATYRIFYDAESAGEEYGFEFVVSDSGNLQIGEPFKRDPTDENYTPTPDLRAVTAQGNDTSLPVLTGGYMAYAFPDTIDASHVLVKTRVEYKGQMVDGVSSLSIERLSELLSGNAVADYEIIAHYEPVPVDTTADYEIIAHYEPDPTQAGNLAPGKPTSVSIAKVGTGTDAVMIWRLADGRETRVEVQVKNADGTWGAEASLAARSQSTNISQIGYAVTKTYRVRATNSYGVSPWSDEVSVRFNTFIYDVFLGGEGQPPVRLGGLTNNSQAQLPATNANIGVLIRDHTVNVPTREDYDRIALYVELADGSWHGWKIPDINAGPSVLPAWIFPRPGGTDVLTGKITVKVELYLGTVLVDQQSVTVTLVDVPTKPLAPSALRASRTNAVVSLNWVVNATNADYQRVEFKPQGGEWQKLVDLLGGDTGFSTPDLKVNGAGVTYLFRVLAGNKQGESDYSNEATLTPETPANRPPVMPALADQSATVGLAFAYSLPAIGDPDGDAVTIALTGLGQGLAYDAGAKKISGTPSASGILTVTVTATDSHGASSVGSLRITIGVPANRAPVAPAVIDRLSYRGTAITIVLPAFTDPDGDGLTYAMPSGLPPGLAFTASTRTVSGTPTGSGSADVAYTMQYAATDTKGATTMASFYWTIRAPQVLPPVAPALPTLNLGADAPYFETVLPAFTDPQNQTLTYSLTDMPEGLSFEAATRKVSGYAETSGQIGATYSATNTSGLTTSATQLFMISLPTITQVRGRLRSLGGTDWVLEAEVTISQRGLIRHHTDRLRNRSPYYADALALLNSTTTIIEIYSNKSTNPGTGTYAQPPGGVSNYYLHLQVARNPATYAVYGFWLENYYDWTVASKTEPLPPLAES
ncbi:putative Ig domain-containing protein [Fibrella forsythiae]|uniref:Fibronectin type-III domain-containing protein n=1 Tax=Fibrella forsythiae TaxID=2817061 RepID=A0ABS3JBX1_9BACT|nr:putative Ig domain-containing protein [Fibrella forsythiae]MBO0947487.1 hypothetical protein [Fibrella forsythiae]